MYFTILPIQAPSISIIIITYIILFTIFSVDIASLGGWPYICRVKVFTLSKPQHRLRLLVFFSLSRVVVGRHVGGFWLMLFVVVAFPFIVLSVVFRPFILLLLLLLSSAERLFPFASRKA